MPPLVLDKPQGFQKKPLFINVANKLIKLLDETVLNPSFQYTEEAATMVSNNIDILNNFIASKASSITTNITSNTINNNMENDTITTTTSSSAEPSQKSTNGKLGLSNRRAVKRKPSKDSTNFKIKKTKSKKENTKSIKKRIIQLKIKEVHIHICFIC